MGVCADVGGARNMVSFRLRTTPPQVSGLRLRTVAGAPTSPAPRHRPLHHPSAVVCDHQGRATSLYTIFTRVLSHRYIWLHLVCYTPPVHRVVVAVGRARRGPSPGRRPPCIAAPFGAVSRCTPGRRRLAKTGVSADVDHARSCYRSARGCFWCRRSRRPHGVGLVLCVSSARTSSTPRLGLALLVRTPTRGICLAKERRPGGTFFDEDEPVG